MVALQRRPAQADRNGEAAGFGKQVLLIEGQADARETLADLLGALGYQVTAVAGVAGARQMAEAPRVIISDLSVSGGTIFELLPELRRQAGWGQVPVIALTAHDDPENRRRAREAGCHEFLVKPVSIWALHRALQQLVVV